MMQNLQCFSSYYTFHRKDILGMKAEMFKILNL